MPNVQWEDHCSQKMSKKEFFDASCHVVTVNDNCATLVYVFIEPTYTTSDVTTESAIYILYIFANNFGTNGQSTYFFMLFPMKQ